MNVAMANTQQETATEAAQMCVWKMVLTNNINGEGTSFDPAAPNLEVARCLRCDGTKTDCHRYADLDG